MALTLAEMVPPGYAFLRYQRSQTRDFIEMVA
jgi:hypothetical protein